MSKDPHSPVRYSDNRVGLVVARLISYIKRNDYAVAFVAAVCFIVIGAGIGWYNNKVVLPNPSPIAHYNLEPGNKLSFLSNWDGPNYISIASKGYSSIGLTNFFPLYPLLIRLVHNIISSYLISALLVSWLSLIGAIYFYIKIVKTLYKDRLLSNVLQALLIFLLFPSAIFLLATYTESLFSALALGAIYFALTRRYLYAAILLAFCGATHITGMFVIALIGLILIEHKESIQRIITTVIVGSLGLLGYMYYLDTKFHKPLAFITEQKNHGWLKSTGFANLYYTIDLFNVLFIFLLIAAILYWWRRRKSFSIYSFLFLCIPLAGKQFGGFNRYVLVAFPIPLMLYGWTMNKKPLYYNLLIVISAISWTYFALQYAGGYIGG